MQSGLSHRASVSRWAAVQTQPRREELALQHLARQKFKTFCPRRRQERKIGRQGFSAERIISRLRLCLARSRAAPALDQRHDWSATGGLFRQGRSISSAGHCSLPATKNALRSCSTFSREKRAYRSVKGCSLRPDPLAVRGTAAATENQCVPKRFSRSEVAMAASMDVKFGAPELSLQNPLRLPDHAVMAQKIGNRSDLPRAALCWEVFLQAAAEHSGTMPIGRCHISERFGRC